MRALDSVLASDCMSCPIKGRGFCTDHSGEVLAAFRRDARLRVYDVNTPGVGQEELAETIGCVTAGRFKVTILAEDGRESILHFLEPTDLVGSYLLATPNFRIQAVKQSQICWQDGRTVSRLAADHPEVGAVLRRALEHQVRQVSAHMALLSLQGARERLVAYIFSLIPASSAGDVAGPEAGLSPSPLVVRFPIGRRDIAAYLDMSIETISRNIHFLSDAGLLRILDTSTFEIPDAHRLAALSFRLHDGAAPARPPAGTLPAPAPGRETGGGGALFEDRPRRPRPTRASPTPL